MQNEDLNKKIEEMAKEMVRLIDTQCKHYAGVELRKASLDAFRFMATQNLHQIAISTYVKGFNDAKQFLLGAVEAAEGWFKQNV